MSPKSSSILKVPLGPRIFEGGGVSWSQHSSKSTPGIVESKQRLADCHCQVGPVVGILGDRPATIGTPSTGGTGMLRLLPPRSILSVFF
jgi:hypothetical protein